MKRKIFSLLLFTFAVLNSIGVYAQPGEAPAPKSAPIPLEIVLGGDGWVSQMIIDKKFAPESKFGFFGLSYLKADYDNAEFLRESINLAFLKYDIFKGVSLMSGAIMNSQWGFRPYAGAQYGYHSRTFMGVVNSGFHLTETKNFESLAILEYRPPIKGAWSLYSRAQGLYSYNSEIDAHDRSHFYARLGVSYKNYSFGGAYNYDCYGPHKITNNQFGIFLGVLLQ
ncbi:hypothetical protein [uncultured Draconibacterium sp.]|uniref:hypothetical protein n=1 Tax=uncultured Draconibacterium sp. TaxID=1573823 RepID=UPI002AA85A03|nr:hypothetical protein [uncultured Draconibacterium sp.]